MQENKYLLSDVLVHHVDIGLVDGHTPLSKG